ncbi:sulfotransferase family protein [Nitratireductor sp. ZSWI3]|uniref:sulfotransferase family protein n=1 Tax=Nitratireductor sp. ZSWI3 TaxID=2966359 RepID=UPI00214FEE51|nr:hypothetical protein [Nitratireductor sp. ZSWI3]MCR4265857.1 hypothetical protein [Nitratireductor sp. ZSWI3]
MKKAIVILGMHRSGTSAITRVLNLLGAFLPEKLVAAQPNDNATGFWEPVDAVMLNEQLLASVGSNWIESSRFPVESVPEPALKAFRQGAGEFIDQQYSGHDLIVLKDPRVCRLFPLWEEVLRERGYAAHVILALRSPWECARSLYARNEYPLEAGLLSWLRYELQAERDSRSVPRCATSYEKLLSDWRAVVAGISASLGIQWPVPVEQAEADIDAFLSAGARHQFEDRFEASFAAEVAEVWQSLRDMESGPLDAARTGRLDQILADLDSTDRYYRSIMLNYPGLIKARRAAEIQLEHEKRRSAEYLKQREAWKVRAQKET